MIPQEFNYSQSSLTAFARCRRQFLLCYVERLAWPAPQPKFTIEYVRSKEVQLWLLR